MPSFRLRGWSVAIAVCAVVALVGAGAVISAAGTRRSSVSPTARSAAASSTFTLAISADPGALDPQTSPLAAVQQIAMFLYDPLLHQHGKGFVSGLASSWSQHGESAVFHIRSGVTCSNGQRLTAATVAANLNYVAGKRNASPLAGITVPTGAHATASGAVVDLKLPQPDPFLLQGISNLPIVCAKGLAHRGILTQGADGSGPYVLSSSDPGSRYTLTRRSGYSWGPSGQTNRSMPAKVVVEVITDQTTVANLLLSGSLSAGVVSGPDVSRLKAAHYREYPMNSMYGELFYNEASTSPVSSATIRRGLTEALNLDALEKVSTSGLGTVPTMLTGTSPCDIDTVRGNLPRQNVVAARAALAPLRGHTLTLLYLSKLGPAAAAAAQLAVQEWKAAGVTVVATGETDDQLLHTVYETGNFDIAWVPIDGQNPSQTYPEFTGPTPAQGGGNFASIDDTDYARYADAALAKNGTAGCRLWAKADSSLVKQSDVVPFADSDYPFWSSSKWSFSASYYGVLPATVRAR